MKKSVGVLSGVLVLIMLIFATSSLAAMCGDMRVLSIASNESLSSGAQVWLMNEGTTDCGPVKPGGRGLYNLPANTSDKTMALILTAISLGKTFWIYAPSDPDDSTDPYTPGELSIVSLNAQ